MADMTTYIDLRINYSGVFYLNKKNEVCYRKGEKHSYAGVDSDLVSKVVLENMFEEDIGLKNIMEMWFLEPGKKIDNGLKLLADDRVVMECVNLVGGSKLMHLYVVQHNEASPTTLKNQSPNSQPTCLSIVPSK